MNLWRWTLLPFSAVYGLITYLRNVFFDLGLFKTHLLEGKSICIGNLNVGGSGKSPLTRYLMLHLQKTHSVQVLSRGYGRKTQGHLQLNHEHSAADVGDEPLMYFSVAREQDEVHVAENRNAAIQGMDRTKGRILLLDDAFQHRRIRAGLSIVVSSFDTPYFKDFILPVGNLREWRFGIKRADAIVYTKCPDSLSDEDKRVHKEHAHKYGIPCFFSQIIYPPLKAIGPCIVQHPTHALVVTAIAHPGPLYQHLEKQYVLTRIAFSDHHPFTLEEIQEIHQKFDTFDSSKTIVITTEKDLMKLRTASLMEKIQAYPWYVQPMDISMDREEEFLTFIQTYASEN